MIPFFYRSGFKKLATLGSAAGNCCLLLLVLTFETIGTPCFADENELSVFRVEIDTTPLGARNGSQVTRDIYIKGGEENGLGRSHVLDVYRRKSVQGGKDGGSFEISILVGRVEVIDLSKTVAIARTVALTSAKDTPVLRYRAVMVGDYAVPVRAEGGLKGDRLEEKVYNRGSAVLLPSTFLFGRNEWKLKEEAKGMLATINGMFNKGGDNSILVAGYTCSLGMEKYNLELSKKRARSVADYLIMNSGIPEDNIRIEYHGEKFPVASNNTEEGRLKNRRVEIRFLPPDLMTQN